MFYHAVHLLNHGSALESGTLGLHGAQFCALAGDRDAGVVCTCASRVLSCPEPAIVGTTKGLHVDLPQLGNKASVKAFLAKHPNNAYLVIPVPDHRRPFVVMLLCLFSHTGIVGFSLQHNKPTVKERDPIGCSRINRYLDVEIVGVVWFFGCARLTSCSAKRSCSIVAAGLPGCP